MTSAPPAGRLTLSWVGKDRSLLETDTGGYEWVDRDDPRVTEVRLLREREIVGDHTSGPDGSGNLLVLGDAYDVLHALTRVPKYADNLLGKVKLVYIDPPFNTGQAFAQYDDALEHSVWLTMMRDRLLLVRDLLSADGSVWVHLDDAEMAYCRVLLDEIFGRTNFVATIIWQRSDSPRNDAIGVSVDHDYIVCFARDKERFRLGRLDRTAAMDAVYKNPDGDRRGSWHADNLTCNKTETERPNLAYTIVDPVTGTPYPHNPRRVWVYEKDRMEHLIADRRVIFPKQRTGRPQLKRFLNELSRGRAPQTVWPHEEVGHTRGSKREIQNLFPGLVPFATPKPERLLQRIIHIASLPGDVVLDCFAGSGTTAAVAHKMGRRWVAVEKGQETFETFTRARMKKVVAGEDRGGVTEAVGWAKGSGFRVLEVAPSMYDVQDGRAFLAEWVTNGAFAEGVVAQLGFRVEHDAPFSGRKGRSRLAVVDGVIDPDVVRAIVSRLGEDERAVLVGKGATPDAGDLLKSSSPGSRLRKAPRDLLKRGVVR